MKRYSLSSILLAVSMLALTFGCSVARVTNEARYKTTGLDGIVTERYAINKIVAFGDKAVEQNLKGSLADATEADLSAGIQESTQKSESGIIAEKAFGTIDRALELGVEYLAKKDLTPKPSVSPVANTAPAVTGEVPTAAANASTGAAAITVPIETSEREETVYAGDGYDGVPGINGVGVYGQPTCSRCRAYHAAHPGVAIVNVATSAGNSAMWAALRSRGYTATSVSLPVEITETGFVQKAK